MAYQDTRTATGRQWQRQLARPRVWPITSGDILAVLIANGVIIVGMWVRHGGLAQLDTTAGIATAVGQVTALLGTYLRAGAAGADVPQPVAGAGPGLGATHGLASLDGLRLPLAARRPCSCSPPWGSA